MKLNLRVGTQYTVNNHFSGEITQEGDLFFLEYCGSKLQIIIVAGSPDGGYAALTTKGKKRVLIRPSPVLKEVSA